MDYSSKQVVVTGAAGFIGFNLVEELCSLGANVTALDLPNAAHEPYPPGVREVCADIRDLPSLAGVFDNAEYVFHLAARTDLDGKTLDEYSANYRGTQNIIECLRTSTQLARLVVYSTQLVVGIFNERRFISPDEPYRTRTLYGESKIRAEKAIVDLCAQYKLPYTIVRPTSVYGPRGRQPYRDFFLTLKRGRYFHIGRADNLVSMAYVMNVIDQTLFLAADSRAQAQIFFSTDFHPYTQREFADAVAQYFGYELKTLPDAIVYPAAYAMGVLKGLGFSMPLYPFRLKNIKANYCYDISNSVRLGWHPKYALSEGVRETLDWYALHDPAFQKPG